MPSPQPGSLAKPSTPAIEALRAVPLFAPLRLGDLEYLSRVLRTQEYPKNRVILFAQDPCEAFYILRSGQVKVMLVAEDGREVILSLRNTGEFFGEAALLDNEPQSASVIATEESAMYILRRDDFHRCITQMPGVAFGLLRSLYARLREADQKIGGLILLDVAGRICHLVLQLADSNDGTAVARPPTHQVMAQMIGSSRETVSRTIKSLAAQGLLELSRTSIKILDRAAVETAAGRSVRRRKPRVTPHHQRAPVEYPQITPA